MAEYNEKIREYYNILQDLYENSRLPLPEFLEAMRNTINDFNIGRGPSPKYHTFMCKDNNIFIEFAVQKFFEKAEEYQLFTEAGYSWLEKKEASS